VVAQAVDEFRPQLSDLRDTLAAMRADSPLFARWIAAQRSELALFLRFDDHGKKVDVCSALTVMLGRSSTPAEVKRVLGIDPSLVAALYGSRSSATLDAIDPMMRTFFVAAGLPRPDAKELTS